MYNMIIVEDMKLSCVAIEYLFSNEEDFNIIANIRNAANAYPLCIRGNIDLILMDICTADNESGIEAARRIKADFPKIKVVLMTSMPEFTFIDKARKAGCDSFWYKEDNSYDVVEICRRTLRGETVYPVETPTINIGLTKSSELTDKELLILKALVNGKKYHEVAEYLDISDNTVKYHIKNILQKTGFENTTRLVADVVEKKFIMPGF